MLDFFAFAVAVVALIIAAATQGKLRDLRARLAELERPRTDPRARLDAALPATPAEAETPASAPTPTAVEPPPLPEAAAAEIAYPQSESHAEEPVAPPPPPPPLPHRPAPAWKNASAPVGWFGSAD